MIDILLGADYYYEVVTGEIIKGDTDPTAVASKFGWLLTGPVNYAVLCLPIQLLVWLLMVMEPRSCLGSVIML